MFEDKQLAEMVEVSHSTVLNFLYHNLVMSKVGARWCSECLLASKTTVHSEFMRILNLCRDNKGEVLNRIVTGDETWVRHYEPESKQE